MAGICKGTKYMWLACVWLALCIAHSIFMASASPPYASIVVLPENPAYVDDFVIMVEVNATYLKMNNFNSIRLDLTKNGNVLCDKSLSINDSAYTSHDTEKFIIRKNELRIERPGDYSLVLFATNATSSKELMKKEITIRKLKIKIMLTNVILRSNGSIFARVNVTDEKGKSVGEGRITVGETGTADTQIVGDVKNGIAEFVLPKAGNFTIVFNGTDFYDGASMRLELGVQPVKFLIFDVRSERDVSILLFASLAIATVALAMISVVYVAKRTGIISQLKMKSVLSQLERDNNDLRKKISGLTSENYMLKRILNNYEMKTITIENNLKMVKSLAPVLRDVASKSGKYAGLLETISRFVEEPSSYPGELRKDVLEKIVEIENAGVPSDLRRKLADKHNATRERAMEFHKSVDTSIIEDMLERAEKEVSAGDMAVDSLEKLAHYKAAEALIEEARSLLDKSEIVDRLIKLRILGYRTTFMLKKL